MKQFLLQILGLSSIYLLLGVLFTFPLIQNISTKVPNNLYQNATHTYEWGDHLQIIAGFNEHKYILRSLLNNDPIYTKEFCLNDIQSCEMNNLKFTKQLILSPYWGQTLLNTVFDDVKTNNIFILSTFVLSGLSSFYLCRYFATKFLTNKSHQFISNLEINAIALFGSLFVTLAPSRLHHLFVGHKNGWLVICFVLIILTFELARNKSNLTLARFWTFCTAFLLLFLSFTEHFFLYYGLIYLGLRIIHIEVAFILHNSQLKLLTKKKYYLQKFSEYMWVIITSLVLIIINYFDKLKTIGESTINNGRPFEEIIGYSPKFPQFFTNGIFDHELNIYLGIGSLMILSAIVYILFDLLRNRKCSLFTREFGFFLLFIIFMLLITLGSNTPLYKILYEYLPGFKFSRTPARAILLALPFIGIVSSMLIIKLRLHFAQLSKLLSLFMIISLNFATILSLYSFQPISLVSLPNKVFAQANYKEEKILFIPFTDAGNFFGSIYEFNVADYPITTINGYDPFPRTDVLTFENNFKTKLNSGNIDIQLLKDLKDKYGVTKISVLKKYYNSADLAGLGYNLTDEDLHKTLNILNIEMHRDFENDEYATYGF